MTQERTRKRRGEENVAEDSVRDNSIALRDARPGRFYQVSEIHGGDDLQQRLADMGMGPGAVFAVERKGVGGPLVVSVKGSRLVLGQGVIDKIRVAPCI